MLVATISSNLKLLVRFPLLILSKMILVFPSPKEPSEYSRRTKQMAPSNSLVKIQLIILPRMKKLPSILAMPSISPQIFIQKISRLMGGMDTQPTWTWLLLTIKKSLLKFRYNSQPIMGITLKLAGITLMGLNCNKSHPTNTRLLGRRAPMKQLFTNGKKTIDHDFMNSQIYVENKYWGFMDCHFLKDLWKYLLNCCLCLFEFL